MFYEFHKRDRQVLPHDPFKAMIAPRPIGWISSVSAQGAINLAPYSFFNALSNDPPLLGFSSTQWKDSVAFISESGEFTWNLATRALAEAMNQTGASLPRGVNEFDFAGLAMAPGQMVRAPRVAASPAAMECKLVSITQLADMTGAKTDNFLVIGQVVGVYMDDSYVVNGRFDTARAAPLARCGYADYADAGQLFEIQRPA